MKILYFTGTGNTLYVARELGVDATIYSIPKLLKQEEFIIEDDIVGIVVPIYALRIPHLVDEYLSKVKINAKYTFFIFTHALLAFDTRNFASKYSFNVNYSAHIKMPNNFLIAFDMKKTNQKDYNYNSKLLKIKQDIENKVESRNVGVLVSTLGRFARIFNKTSYESYYKKDSEFIVDSTLCTQCMICERVCSSNNITVLKDNFFNQNCMQCLACINCCPTKAIKHKRQKSDERYLNKYIKINDLID